MRGAKVGRRCPRRAPIPGLPKSRIPASVKEMKFWEWKGWRLEVFSIALAGIVGFGLFGLGRYVKARKTAAAATAAAAAETAKEVNALADGDLIAWSNYVYKAATKAIPGGCSNVTVTTKDNSSDHSFVITEKQFAEYMRQGLRTGHFVHQIGGTVEDCDWLIEKIVTGHTNVLEQLLERLEVHLQRNVGEGVPPHAFDLL